MDISVRNSIILDYLLQYLDTVTLVKCCAVCKDWYNTITSNNRLWKRICQFENIDPEEWNWPDNEEWILDPPCDWMQYVLKYKRTEKNLKTNKNKCYDFKINCLYIDYDGKTLILGNRNCLKIYKLLENKSIEFLENIEIQGNIHDAKTNTEFIVLQWNKCLCVYKFVNNLYEFYYKICSNRIGDIIYVNEFTDNFTSFLYTNKFYFWEESLCYDLYVNNSLDNYRFYGWKINDKQLVLNLNNHYNLDYDKNFLYITNKDRNLLVLFNKQFVKHITINLEYNLFKIFTINDTLNIWEIDSESKSWISTIRKSSGKILMPKRKLNYNFEDAVAIIFPKEEFFIIFDCSHRLTAFRLNDLYICKYWERPLHCETFHMKNYRLWDPKIFYKFRKIFAIVRAIGLYSNESINSDTLVNVYDIRNCNLLYTINLGIMSLMKTPFVFNDVIICFRQDDMTSVYLYR
ncbi:hypothetical protein O3M35_002772 [Rhynocoris fuscipes]|uniref:F-box domain-containing protein n=1 Tax=Rhynocoris fuscipes TaxID=488301 RepID=A0AAW1CN12_9HEMI